MYIHLGGEKVILTSELIAIFDISIEKSGKDAKPFIDYSNQDQLVEKIGEEDPKSLVVTPTKLYYSPISSTTLKKRAIQLASN